MSEKRSKRLRRSRKTRALLKLKGKQRLCVHRSLQHIHAQVISADGSETLACASTTEPSIRSQVKYGGNMEAARLVGAIIAERAKQKNIESVGFDRSGYRYHGRVKALADAAREAGLKI